MNKIIAASDSKQFDEKQLLHFQAMAKMLNSTPVVIFLQNLLEEIIPAAAFPDAPFVYYSADNEIIIKEQENLTKEKVDLFHELCAKKSIEAILHRKNGMPVEDIVSESRFADLLMIHNNTTLSALPDTDPPKFVKDVLKRCECPVLILPTEQKAIDEIVFTYNGSLSSMYAIKHFTSLFGGLTTQKITILIVDEKGEGEVKNEALIWEYLDFHYKDYQVKIMGGDPAFMILDYAITHPNSLLTLGAYGRSGLSQFFHHSNAEKALHHLNNYFFITHP